MWLKAKAFPLTPARVAGEKGAGACGGVASGGAVCEHPVDDPVRDGFLCVHEVVAFHVLGDLLERLPAVLSDQLLDPPLERDRLPCLDLAVARRALEAAPELVDDISAFGSAIRFPCAPPASRSAPTDIAIPTAIVVIAGLTYCIAS